MIWKRLNEIMDESLELCEDKKTTVLSTEIG
jgi:hypothetical protein